MHKFLLVLSFLSVCLCSIYGQQDSLAIQYDKAEIERFEIHEDDLSTYRNDSKYNYEEKSKTVDEGSNFLDEIWQWIIKQISRFFEWIVGVDAAPHYIAYFLKFIPYILLGILLFLIVWWVLKINIRNQKKAEKNWNTVNLTEEENIIKNKNIDLLIQEALDSQNYRLAVRYYYLLILKLLGEKEFIDWEPHKTNSDYLYEIEKPALKTPFAEITRSYDYIWYGDFTIDEIKYKKVAIAFDSLKNTLRKNA